MRVLQASLAASTQSSEASPFAGFLADPAEGWWVDHEPPQQQAPRLRPLHVPPRSSASSVGTRGSNPSTERTRGSSSGDGGGSGPGLSSPEGLSRQGSGGACPPMERIGEPDDVFHAEQGAPGACRTRMHTLKPACAVTFLFALLTIGDCGHAVAAFKCSAEPV